MYDNFKITARMGTVQSIIWIGRIKTIVSGFPLRRSRPSPLTAYFSAHPSS
jgi:hypothetical protein